jgi:ABC-type transporter Mla subunit MlaD
MATAANLYQELKDALTQFKTFLDSTTTELKPAIAALKAVVPQIGDLLTQLITLMNQLKDAISKLDVNAIPGLDKVTQFTSSVTALLQTAESLLPDQKAAIDTVLGAANVVTSLPSVTAIKQDILDLLTGIINDLTALNQ